MRTKNQMQQNYQNNIIWRLRL